MEENKTSNTNSINVLSVPAAIIVAGVLIAGAVLYSSGGRNTALAPSNTQGGAVVQVQPSPVPPSAGGSAAMESVKPVSSSDHIRGNPNALVKVVEFSDTECPFCKRFHATMRQAVEEYEGKIAWVYRHFPLDSLHSKARKEAEATECANELGGNEKFWAYLDRLFEVTPSNDGLDPVELPKIAQYVGLDKAKFEQCLSSGKYAAHVAEDLADATATGGQGTPWSIVIAANGKKFAVSGAQPYATVKATLDAALSEK